MKVILLKKIKQLGEIGDIKEVADGYALNFLFPQKIAEPATNENISQLKMHRNEEIKKEEEDLVLDQQKVKKLQGIVLELKGKCSGEGKLYSSVSAAMIADKLKEKGIAIEKKQINLTKPIKEVGEHTVFIVLNHGLEAEITVVVNE